ncbi:ATP-binding protein [Streptomyces sp. NPDC026672]|uniref:ATP-binding protein n=1 Tax=unclassified Streptomyces TaxID=2593676 RepID=UPI003407D198
MPEARRLVRRALLEWQLTDLRADAQLVVSELTTNCVQHAPDSGTIRVTVQRLTDVRVRVGVEDRSHQLPRRRPVGPDALDGRGLALVAAVSIAWGVEPLPDGKHVWADLESTGLEHGRTVSARQGAGPPEAGVRGLRRPRPGRLPSSSARTPPS